MDYVLVGEVIREERRRRGMTQEELSDGVCSVSSLSKIENSRQMPHYATLAALLEKLGAPVVSPCYISVEELKQWRVLCFQRLPEKKPPESVKNDWETPERQEV